MTDDRRSLVPAGAPTEHDAVLAALPVPVLAGGAVSLAAPVSLVVALGAGSLVAALIVAGALVVASPV